MDDGRLVNDLNARYADCETDEDCWREYLDDDYDNLERLIEIGDAAQARRWR